MSINYRPEINGLRALAIIPVIFFHADFEIFRNGYLGVDIFFVISGYLITSLIIKDLVNDNFSIYFFLEKRARRILPNLYFILFVTLFFSWILLGRSELSSYLKSLAATILFLSNFFFWSEIPYFDSEANLKPLLHTWSLSIEGQFYIFFPFLLTLIYKLKKKILIHILVIIFFLSLLLCFLGLLNRVNANFYFTITRIWELLMGGIAAFLIIKKKFSFSERLDNIFSLFGLILIILSFFFNFYHDYVPAALFPAIGTAMIIIFSNKYTVVARLLSTKIFLQIGIISYSLYLWHYPILAFAKNYYHEINFNLKIFLIFLSFVLSIFTYKLIELPFRDNNFINKNKFLKLITFLSIFFF
jgi:peptidoglycan/LPS O-acetylase OafA/YrhL